MMLEVIDGMPTRYLDVNDTYTKSLGYSIEECLKIDPYTVIPQAFLDRLPDIMKILYHDKRISYEVSCIAKDGLRIPVEVTIFLFSAKKHDVMLVFSHDITERKKAEIKFQEIFNKISDAVVLTDLSTKPGRYIEVNNAFVERIGYTREELLNMFVGETFSGETNPPLPLVYEALDKEGSITFETEDITKDGTYIPTEVKTHKINLLGEEVLLSISRDITERKKAESALKESEAKYASILRAASIGIGAVDNRVSRRFTYLSNFFLNMVGYTREELMGQKTRIVYATKEEYERIGIKLYQDMDKRGIGITDSQLKHKDGQIIDIQINLTPFDPANPSAGVTFTALDITERKKAERLNKELEERRDNFIWMTSHELRTPLTVILGFTDLLWKKHIRISQDQQDKVYRIIRNNLNRLERLTDQVSLIAQFKHGTFQIKESEFDFCIFLNDALEPYKNILGEQLKIDTSQCMEPTIVIGDNDRLLQVIDNILNNAVKQTHPKNRLIEVKFKTSPNLIQVIIADNGIGIASENLERIFEQFVSIETEYSATGTGIGLFLSQQIMEAHGGTIKTHSEGRRLGSVFTFESPRRAVE